MGFPNQRGGPVERLKVNVEAALGVEMTLANSQWFSSGVSITQGPDSPLSCPDAYPPGISQNGLALSEIFPYSVV